MPLTGTITGLRFLPCLRILCRVAEGNSRETMPHRIFSVLEGSLLTFEQGPISLLTLRSQSALALNEGTHCILGRNTASMYVFRD